MLAYSICLWPLGLIIDVQKMQTTYKVQALKKRIVQHLFTANLQKIHMISMMLTEWPFTLQPLDPLRSLLYRGCQWRKVFFSFHFLNPESAGTITCFTTVDLL